MNAPRVVHVVGSLEPWGTQRQLLEVIRAAQADGIESVVIAAGGGLLAPAFSSAGADVRIVGGTADPSWAVVARCVRGVSAARPSLVHLWDEWSLRHVGPVLGLRRRVPYVCAVRNPPPRLGWARRQVDLFALRRAAAIVSDSHVLRDAAAAAYGNSSLSDKWLVLPFAVEIPSFASDRAELLARLGFPANVRLLVAACHFTLDKNLRDVLFAAALLRMAHADVRLVLCGDGPQTAELRHFCRAMHIEDITVFTGAVDDAVDYIRACDVYVDAALRDGPSRGVAEAWRCGVPTVCVDSPIRREQVRFEGDALLYPARDPGALTRQIHQLLRDEPLRARLAGAILEGATAWDAPAATAAYVQLYRAIV